MLPDIDSAYLRKRFHYRADARFDNVVGAWTSTGDGVFTHTFPYSGVGDPNSWGTYNRPENPFFVLNGVPDVPAVGTIYPGRTNTMYDPPVQWTLESVELWAEISWSTPPTDPGWLRVRYITQLAYPESGTLVPRADATESDISRVSEFSVPAGTGSPFVIPFIQASPGVHQYGKILEAAWWRVPDSEEPVPDPGPDRWIRSGPVAQQGYYLDTATR